MPERIYKLQPDRTLYLRGFNTFAAAASIHNASPTGFQISGVFRDPADFAVAVLYDADNAFEHPSIKYLPDFNFAGLTLELQPDLHRRASSPSIRPNITGSTGPRSMSFAPTAPPPTSPCWDNAMLADAAFPAASATFDVVASGLQPTTA